MLQFAKLAIQKSTDLASDECFAVSGKCDGGGAETGLLKMFMQRGCLGSFTGPVNSFDGDKIRQSESFKWCRVIFDEIYVRRTGFQPVS